MPPAMARISAIAIVSRVDDRTSHRGTLLRSMLYGDLRYCIPRGRRGFMSPEANKGLRGRQRYNSCITK